MRSSPAGRVEMWLTAHARRSFSTMANPRRQESVTTEYPMTVPRTAASYSTSVRSRCNQAIELRLYDNPRHLHDLEVAPVHVRQVVQVVVVPAGIRRTA